VEPPAELVVEVDEEEGPRTRTPDEVLVPDDDVVVSTE
jgi:hypothetical protein